MMKRCFLVTIHTHTFKNCVDKIYKTQLDFSLYNSISLKYLSCEDIFFNCFWFIFRNIMVQLNFLLDNEMVFIKNNKTHRYLKKTL